MLGSGVDKADILSSIGCPVIECISQMRYRNMFRRMYHRLDVALRPYLVKPVRCIVCVTSYILTVAISPCRARTMPICWSAPRSSTCEHFSK